MSRWFRVDAPRGLRLRAAPIDGRVLTVLEHHEKVEVIGRDGWVHVRAGSFEGYVHRGYLSEDLDPARAPAAAPVESEEDPGGDLPLDQIQAALAARGPLQISEHFSLRELTATDVRLDNWLSSARLVRNLEWLCRRVLQPARAHFGLPVSVNSGYRSVAVNAAVHGAENSQHMRGEAVDFEVPGVPNIDLARWVRDAVVGFDQLILECYRPGDPSSGWVHVSMTRATNRGEVLTAAKVDGRMRYRDGLNE